MPDNNVKGSQNLQTQLNAKMAQIDTERREESAKNVAQSVGLQYVDLAVFPIDNNALFLVAETAAKNANLAVIARNGSKLPDFASRYKRLGKTGLFN